MCTGKAPQYAQIWKKCVPVQKEVIFRRYILVLYPVSARYPGRSWTGGMVKADRKVSTVYLQKST